MSWAAAAQGLLHGAAATVQQQPPRAAGRCSRQLLPLARPVSPQRRLSGGILCPLHLCLLLLQRRLKLVGLHGCPAAAVLPKQI